MLLSLGIPATLLYDHAPTIGATSGSSLEWVLFALALILRLFTYLVLFASCRMLAQAISKPPRRAIVLALSWTALGMALAGLIWVMSATSDSLYYTPAIKRFTPDTIFQADPDFTIAQVALGTELAARYTWVNAISLEMIAILVSSLATAFCLKLVAGSRRGWLAYLAPIVSVMVFLAYAFVAPWSFDWDFDFFIGDALVGVTLFNAISFPITLLYGNFTAPSVWVSLIAITNVALLMKWRPSEPPQNVPA